MFTRVLEYRMKSGSHDKLLNIMNTEILTTLRNYQGFVDLIMLTKENDPDTCLSFTFWNNKADADRYAKEGYPKILNLMTPHLMNTPTVTPYNIETSTIQRIAAGKAA